MLPIRGGGGRAAAVHSAFHSLFCVFVALFFGKLITVSGNQGSNGGGIGSDDGNREYFDPRFRRLLWYLIGSE